MPAFLLISGFFIRSTFVFKEEMEKKLKRLMIPYLFFSILLGTIARNGAFLKQLLGTIWGGVMLMLRIAHFPTILLRHCFVHIVFIMH